MLASPKGDRFLGAVEAIYDAAPEPSRWPHALGAIADYFDDVGAILIWHRTDGSYGTIVSEKLEAAQRDYEENGWASRDIKAIRAQARGYFFNGEPFADRHIGDEEELKNHPCSVQFFGKHGLGYIGGVAVSPNPHVGVALSVQRNARAKPQFSDAELEDLRKISRHVEKSLRLSVRLLNAEVANLGLGQARGAYVTGETKTPFKGYYRASTNQDEALLRSFVQFDGEGETANARERAVGGHPAVALKGSMPSKGSAQSVRKPERLRPVRKSGGLLGRAQRWLHQLVAI